MFSPQANLAAYAAFPSFGADPHDEVVDARIEDLVAGDRSHCEILGPEPGVAGGRPLAWKDIMTIERIAPERAHARVTSSHALLVCAYDSPEAYRDNHLDGAISLQDLQAMEGRLPRDQEIIFYCA